MNKAILIGRLTKDPEFRKTQNGTSVCTFTIAVDRRRKNADGSKTTDFFNIVAWSALADLVYKYLAKGRQAAVSGEIQTRSYDDKNGVKRYVTEIVSDDVQFLSTKNEDTSTTPRDNIDPFFSERSQVNDDSDLPF